MSRSTAGGRCYIVGALWLQRLHCRSAVGQRLHCRSELPESVFSLPARVLKMPESYCRSAVLNMPECCGSDKALPEHTLRLSKCAFGLLKCSPPLPKCCGSRGFIAGARGCIAGASYQNAGALWVRLSTTERTLGLPERVFTMGNTREKAM
ncbi:hypothetical protein AMTR_s00058p00051480 [Amborella trichopoda]|uniref:Uncharacterized protein n=1 Tax=Amborella trichopoda TaxID=13333 RepID=W1PHA8_AMBTC|nr:hypothetical protein AMTR_s00058p00051480 [Amborella trichopoda]